MLSHKKTKVVFSNVYDRQWHTERNRAVVPTICAPYVCTRRSCLGLTTRRLSSCAQMNILRSETNILILFPLSGFSYLNQRGHSKIIMHSFQITLGTRSLVLTVTSHVHCSVGTHVCALGPGNLIRQVNCRRPGNLIGCYSLR